ncbi:hypothetical protein [Ancylobacter sp. G4_0304]|uniref:hypothetical protein n=1 Tax=Ancylobacter sp. G4_0304 TaxID=3114289 RepID=UPI0039C65692
MKSLSDAMRGALQHLAGSPPAHRVRRGWALGDGQIIAPATVDALEARGLVAKKFAGLATVALTAAGKEAAKVEGRS